MLILILSNGEALHYTIHRGAWIEHRLRTRVQVNTTHSAFLILPSHPREGEPSILSPQYEETAQLSVTQVFGLSCHMETQETMYGGTKNEAPTPTSKQSRSSVKPGDWERQGWSRGGRSLDGTAGHKS